MDSSDLLAPANQTIAPLTNLKVSTETARDSKLTVYKQPEKSAWLVLDRPLSSDPEILLSVPGTYSSPSGKVEGFVVLNGKIIQRTERQAWNGAAIFRDGVVSIVETQNGKSLTLDCLKKLESEGASLIQGHLLVHEGLAEPLKEQPLYQRRALVVLKTGEQGIVETNKLMDLVTFADQLVELGVKEAFNLDMGNWSEGWYRDPQSGALKRIGYLTQNTDKQTNWVVFKSGR
ncbi:MAG: phosphodiester glycosidase family protein [bacterium]